MDYHLNELRTAVTYLIEEAEEERVWCFVGEMGAGKTTLIKEICRQLGVTDQLSSPTFSIVNAYAGTTVGEMYHFDFYRIEDPAEVVQLGVEEYFDSGNYCFIEWPDRVADFLPATYVKININLVSDNLRKLTITHV